MKHESQAPAETVLNRFTSQTRTWFQGAFARPTSAQVGAWDAISRDEHALVIAPTGSGKTLSAFLWSLDRLLRTLPAQPGEASSSASLREKAHRASDQHQRQRTRVLYISPLKALGVDVERNLRSPLIGITQTARLEGQDPPHITVGLRSGDTPPGERRRLVTHPPDILITTPESLYLMLTSKARESLDHVETVILDEVHALAGTKRGAHLMLSLERLDARLHKPAQRIGLSATVEPHDEVARFLGGSRPVTVVAPSAEKDWDLQVRVPVPDLADLAASPAPETGLASPVASSSIWPHIEEQVLSLIQANRSTIVFANSRRLAERLTGALNDLHRVRETENIDRAEEPSEQPHIPDLVMAHHGSVSKERRAQIEDDLKSGRLRCVVATSSLELGIDMGEVDLVIQVESPGAVSSGLQRVGRSGHHVGAESRGVFFPKHRGDLVSTTITVQRMRAGQIETMKIPANPLDVLAQHTVAAAAMDHVDVEAWFDTVRRAAPYASLPRSAFEATLDLLAGRYPSDEFAELRPRLVWHRDEGYLEARPGAQRLAVTSGGTIPDRGLFGVFLANADEAGSGNKRVGELDEEMVYESRVGEVIQLGASAWRIEDITHDRVLVSPAMGEPGKLPFWHGDGLGRPAELGQALGAFQARLVTSPQSEAHTELAQIGLDTWAAENLLAYLHAQKESTGSVPSHTRLVVERFQDELGDWRLILHSPWGQAVHAPWALAVSARLQDRFGVDASAMAADDGIVVRLPMAEDTPPGADLFMFEPDELEQLVTEEVGHSALFAARFRECAARALLLPRRDPGKRSPLWQQRQRAAQLLAVASQHPTFPMVMETVREVLQDVYDMPALRRLTEELSARTVRVSEVQTTEPSPFAQNLLFGYVAQFLYEGDSPLAERRAAALSLDPALLNEVLGRGELRELLDADVIAAAEAEAQRVAPSRRAWGLEGAADLLRLLGPLTAEQLAARLHSPDATGGTSAPVTSEGSAASDDSDSFEGSSPASPDVAETWGQKLVAAGRALRVRIRGVEKFAAVEDASRLRDALGIALPMGVPLAFVEPVQNPLEDLVSRFARTHGPFSVEQAGTALGLAPAVVQQTLVRLSQNQRVAQGEFTPGRTGTEWCETQMLRRIRARTLAALRSEVEPTPHPAFARFLASWQDVGSSIHGAVAGTDGVFTVIEQLAGLPLPASAWETLILPARVQDYRPGMLDELLASGEVLFSGSGALAADDGWMAFHPAETAAFTLPLALPEQATDDAAAGLGPTHQRVLEVLGSGGGYFIGQIAAALTVEDSQPVTEAAVGPVLWDLFWTGRITNDSLLPLRSLVTQGKATHKSKATARSRPARPGRGGLRGLRRGAGATITGEARTSQGGAGFSATHRLAVDRYGSGRSMPQQDPTTMGRWSLLPEPETDPTLVAAARAETLLARHGVVTKGAVLSENASFGTLYKVFQRMEETGSVRRGYFVERLGAAQFAFSGTVDRVRSFVPEVDATSQAPQAVTLAATDPANPYGAALPWPEPPGKARPGRKAGALVVLVEGELALYVERGGRTTVSWVEKLAGVRAADSSVKDATEDIMHAVAYSLVATLRVAGTQRMTITTVNGEPVLGTSLARALTAAGFSTLPSGIRFRA